jgi:hypothetical protein
MVLGTSPLQRLGRMLLLRGLCQQTARETSSAITFANTVKTFLIVFAIRAVELPRLRGFHAPVAQAPRQLSEMGCCSSIRSDRMHYVVLQTSEALRDKALTNNRCYSDAVRRRTTRLCVMQWCEMAVLHQHLCGRRC